MNITLAEVVTTTVMFGIVHGIWTTVKWGLRQLKTDTGKIIDKHVKEGHKNPLKHCFVKDCIRLGTAVDSLRSEG